MNGDPLDELDGAWAEVKRLQSVIRRIAEQDCTLAIVNGVIYADDEAVCDIGDRQGTAE